MTSADVEAQFGGTVSPGAIDPSITAGPTCRFPIAGSSLGAGAAAYDRISDEQVGDWQTGERELVASGDAVAVPGIGQSAYYSQGGLAVTFVENGKVYDVDVISFGSSDPTKDKAAVVALAKIVAGNT